MNAIQSSSSSSINESRPRVNPIPPELTRSNSSNIAAPSCGSFLATDVIPQQPFTTASTLSPSPFGDYYSTLESEVVLAEYDDEEEGNKMIGQMFSSNESTETRQSTSKKEWMGVTSSTSTFSTPTSHFINPTAIPSSSSSSSFPSSRNDHHGNHHGNHHGLEDENQWGYLKEEDVQGCISQHYGFVLRVLDINGYSCGLCHWLKGCTGCAILPDDRPLYCLSKTRKIAIDWDPTFLNEHYHQIMYDNTVTHHSMKDIDMISRQNILLSECLQKAMRTEFLQAEKEQIRCERVC